MTDAEEMFRLAQAHLTEPMSQLGRARREALRITLTHGLVRRRRVRRTLRATALATAAVLLVWLWPRPTPQPTPAVAQSVIRIDTVHNDPSVLAAWRATPPWGTTVEQVGEDEVLALLSQSNEPGGIIRMSGHTIVALHSTGIAE